MDTEGQDLTSFDDAMFFGLEEVDGSVFVSGEDLSAQREAGPVHDQVVDDVQESNSITKKKKPRKLRDQSSKDELAAADKSRDTEVADDIKAVEIEQIAAVKTKTKAKKIKQGEDQGQPKATGAPSKLPLPPRISETDSWGGISLNAAIVDSLTEHMKFQWPTTIQSLAAPETLRGETDIVGASETGSGSS